jgi:hypothetical protein
LPYLAVVLDPHDVVMDGTNDPWLLRSSRELSTIEVAPQVRAHPREGVRCCAALFCSADDVAFRAWLTAAEQARGEEEWRAVAKSQGRYMQSMLTATSNRLVLIGDELFETWYVDEGRWD